MSPSSLRNSAKISLLTCQVEAKKPSRHLAGVLMFFCSSAVPAGYRTSTPPEHRYLQHKALTHMLPTNVSRLVVLERGCPAGLVTTNGILHLAK